ncbi:hypothetical protein DM558_03970 [Entomomonas moraniae]|uniref:Lipoprotein n=1 Tax=Entomomonas moraniae TaxID=2213226 RepID=A0A3S9XC30_9GAMM|nr:hypothetical protein [Entomomonas moraniae]AZS49984.1 hypothetical protein DM558_03970 [Entomomonas moraniae]
MKKIVFVCLCLLSTACSQKEVPLSQLFTEKSAFGVKSGMTLEEVSKVLSLEKVNTKGCQECYKSKSSPLQNSLFSCYGFMFRDDRLEKIVGFNDIHPTNSDSTVVYDGYKELIQVIDNKIKNGSLECAKLPSTIDEQTTYVCKKNYSIDIIYIDDGHNEKKNFKFMGITYTFFNDLS